SPRSVYTRLFGESSDGSYMRACINYGNRMTSDFVATLFYMEDEIARCNVDVTWLGVGTEDEYTNPSEQVSFLLSCVGAHSALLVIPRCPHRVSATSPSWPAFCDMLRAWLTVESSGSGAS